MWLLALLALADTTQVFVLGVSPAESLEVTVVRGPAVAREAPVVLIPGLFGSAFAYRGVIPKLTAAGYRVIVIEPLGVGSSARPERADYSLTAQADRIATALDQLGVVGAIVVAHAVGASIAYRLAYRRPELVRGIVALEGGPGLPSRHAARPVGEAVRRRAADPKQDPRVPDRRLGGYDVGERSGHGRLHRRCRPRSRRDAQGLHPDGPLARTRTPPESPRRDSLSGAPHHRRGPA